MLHIQIDENSQQAKLFAEYAKTLPFVTVIDTENDKKNKLIADIKTSLKEVKEGKTKPLKQLLNGK